MFVALPLYIVYALVQGCAFAMADIVDLRVHSFGNIEFLTRTPMAIKAGIGMDVINFIWVSILFAVAMFFIANFMIKKFNLATAGRNGNYDAKGSDELLAMSQKWRMLARKLFKSSTYLVDVITLQMLMLV